ncbi:fibromodulin a [Brienomyrus brachyistius]|uniref:fibromodulin a n=1 Tax=Brienomyrus brachyistius TaxID=42636 RepID=UPI0020B3B505|nr:fibromodulin a [Brienomyrus brachyistius]
MRLFVVLLVALFDLTCCQRQDPFFWLMALRSRGYGPGALQADTTGGDCPIVCDCPPSFPVAMYCDDRGLQEVPYVPSRMKYVYLQYNKITRIRDDAFSNATRLVWVMLHRNQLRSDQISKNAFANLNSLERLYLDHNNLTQVPVNLPVSIRDLRLNNNKISKIETSSFKGMDNLTVLYLHANEIQDVGRVLKDLTSLTLLDLSNNHLKKVPQELPKMLHQLYMESNSIDAVPVNFLSDFSQLQYVRMSHNALTDRGIPPNTFNVSGLVELDLSFNKLEKIPPVSTSLEHLYLQANHIKEFSLSSFCSVVDIMNFSRLRVLRLGGNEINLQDMPSETGLCLRRASTIEI